MLLLGILQSQREGNSLFVSNRYLRDVSNDRTKILGETDDEDFIEKLADANATIAACHKDRTEIHRSQRQFRKPNR